MVRFDCIIAWICGQGCLSRGRRLIAGETAHADLASLATAELRLLAGVLFFFAAITASRLKSVVAKGPVEHRDLESGALSESPRQSRLPGHVDYLRDVAKTLNIPARKLAVQKLRDANALFKIPTVADKAVGLFFDKCASANLDEMPWIKAPVTVVKRYHHISSLIFYSPTAHAPPANKPWWPWSRGGKTEATPSGLRKPVLLDKSGWDSYGDDRFGLYDTNGKSRCDASDVAQLRADHSFFPKALAYNLRE